ncbi:NAD(P)H-hydrate dehydratase [Protofrankia coriariae]|uniref:Bifunctional NAD(P)H-hydrate repair enzyme n=1 Tax=Protofrankia coriariae TaxID=1562887 RepID=A0ABR5F7I4_9ACTN|nr:NAD(P)H-hydrate dehydratase [Protofrankia coriariae]KLL12674.1 carbohydrate kinase [Protofrankia coriariae]
MRSAHTVAQVRQAEARLLASLPPGLLMQRAVHGLLSHAARRLGRVYGARVVVLAGGGDNGGDALWAGARLAARGARVDALAPGRTHPAGTAALLAAGGRLHTVSGPEPADGQPPGPGTLAGDDTAARLLAMADLVLDGLLGIGGKGGLRPEYARLAVRAPRERTVAVDVPSGVDSDTGAVVGPAVRASSTVTFGTYKRGLLVGAGAEHAGEVELVDIGLTLPAADLVALDDADADLLLPVPVSTDSKYTRGVLGLVAGSNSYPGAAVLATGGALRAAAGYLRVVSTRVAADHVRRAHPEAVVTEIDPGDADAVLAAGRVQAWAVGSGLPADGHTARIVAALLTADVPLLLDAGALGVLAQDAGYARALRERAAPTLLTPHEGEFVRLVAALGWDTETTVGELAADRLAVVRRCAAELGVTVLLKGNRTLIVDRDGLARVNTTGTPWLATAGSGDVLTGLCGSLLAGGLDALDAGSVGAHLHGRAASRAGRPLAASDLPALLRQRRTR